MRRVIREAIKIKNVQEDDIEVRKVLIRGIEKEIQAKLILLNSKKNEFHLPSSVAGNARGIAENF